MLQDLRLCACRLQVDQLEQLAAELTRLTELTTLDLRHQGLDAKPGQLGVDMSTFTALTSLHNLQL
jgi:hypothetical protein